MRPWTIALAFIAPLAVAPVAADTLDADSAKKVLNRTWVQNNSGGPAEHYWTWKPDGTVCIRLYDAKQDSCDDAASGPSKQDGCATKSDGGVEVRLTSPRASASRSRATHATRQFETTGCPYFNLPCNPSEVAHMLALPEFSATVEHSSAPAFPYKPAEIDVPAGETVEWYFVPTKAGHYKMGCAIRAHAEAGI